MAQELQKYIFTDTFFDTAANNRSGEYRARFVIQKPGHESEAASLVQAFRSASAKPGLNVKGSTITLNDKQLHDRIAQLEKLQGHAENVDQLKLGVKAIERHQIIRVAAEHGAPVRAHV